VLSNICNASIVQQRSEGGMLTFDCTGYGTPSLKGIPLSCRYGNMSLTSGKVRIPHRAMLWLSLMISKTFNILYDRRCDRVRALGSHHPIWWFDTNSVGIISSAGICKGRRGRLLCPRPLSDSTVKKGVVMPAIDSEP
jgi:hypothetical protein